MSAGSVPVLQVQTGSYCTGCLVLFEQRVLNSEITHVKHPALSTCSTVRVALHPGLQHDSSQAVASYVDGAIQTLMMQKHNQNHAQHGKGDGDGKDEYREV